MSSGEISFKRFHELASRWHNETYGLSSITKKITNLNYLKIIAMGKAVVPLILHSLAQRPDHWFVALKALTDQDPTSPNSSFEEAVEAWLSWGRQEGLIDVTILKNEPDLEAKSRGRKMVKILEKLSTCQILIDVDPVVWQKETRQDRSLPER